jgi:DNA-binding CsgD family transcriptional regulator
MRKPHIRWHVDRGWAGLYLGRGRFREALELAERTRSLPTIVTIARVTGDRLRAELEEGVFVLMPPPFDAVQRLSVAEYALAIGQRDRAEALYADAPFPGSVPQLRFLVTPVTTFHLALAIDLDDAAAVEACYELLLPYRRFHNVGGAGAIITLGSMEVPLGRAARYLGRTHDAIEHLRAGRAINLESGLVPFAAEASLELALALRDTGTPAAMTEAQALIDEAGAVAARLGMKPLAAAADRAKAAAPSTSASSADPLSAREREIAALVAEGLTNKQIAETAHISERTAENHVQHIFTKLGFNTRSQIAVWFTQQQLR